MNDDLIQSMTAPPRDYSGKSREIEPEYAQPFSAWKINPTPENANALVHTLQPVMDTALRPLGNAPALRGHARRITLGALQTYDPAKASLRTHLMGHLQGLKRIAGRLAMPIAIPERVMLQQRDVAEAARDLTDSLGREPSDTEIADSTGLSVKRLLHLRKFRRPISESAASFDNASGEVVGPEVVHDTPQTILENFIYSDLSPRDQLIMDYTLGRNGRPRLNGRDVATQVGVTPGAVSQRLAEIQQRFDTMRDQSLFGG
jgi:DNA-directed RNA polymerase specialized sigma subunit